MHSEGDHPEVSWVDTDWWSLRGIPTGESDQTVAREVSAGEDVGTPLMADLMCGRNAPLAKAFLMAQWRVIPVDRLFGEHHDLSATSIQIELHALLQKQTSYGQRWIALLKRDVEGYLASCQEKGCPSH